VVTGEDEEAGRTRGLSFWHSGPQNRPKAEAISAYNGDRLSMTLQLS